MSGELGSVADLVVAVSAAADILGRRSQIPPGELAALDRLAAAMADTRIAHARFLDAGDRLGAITALEDREHALHSALADLRRLRPAF